MRFLSTEVTINSDANREGLHNIRPENLKVKVNLIVSEELYERVAKWDDPLHKALKRRITGFRAAVQVLQDESSSDKVIVIGVGHPGLADVKLANSADLKKFGEKVCRQTWLATEDLK